MLRPVIIAWNARQLTKAMENGEALFDNAVQRRLVWDKDRESLLIHSMIYGYPIPQMYAIREDVKKVSFIDGKQRSNAIKRFLNDEFELTNIPTVTDENGEEIDLNGLKYSELPEEFKDIVSNYSLHIEYYEDITDDEVAELFFRLNNGVATSAVERSRTRAVSLKEIQLLGQHDLFTTSLTAKAFEKYTHEDLVVKAYIMLTHKEPYYDNKIVRPTMETAIFTEEVMAEMNTVFDRILAVYKAIVFDDSKETAKLSKKIAKRVITRTHMLSIIPVVKKSIEDGVSVELFTAWVKNFFCGAKSPTKYDQYNSKATSGSGHVESVRSRLNVISKDYNNFIKLHKDDVFEKVETVTEVKTEDTNVEVVETEVIETTETATETVVDATEANVEEDTEVVEVVTDVIEDSATEDAMTSEETEETTEVEEIDILGITDYDDDIPENIRAILEAAEAEEELDEAI